MAGLGSTPWVDKNLRAAWDRIAQVSPFGPASMPKVHDGSRLSVVEYGCGHYGCVMPTDVPELVFKLSSDPTEAYFVVAASSLGHWPEGIVRYQSIFRLDGITHKGRPLFAIWREEAFDLGFPVEGPAAGWPGDAYDLRRNKELLLGLQAFKLHANKARLRLKSLAKAYDDGDAFALAAEAVAAQNEVWGGVWWNGYSNERGMNAPDPIGMDSFRGVNALAASIRACAVIAEMMENTDGSDLIGGALGYYLEQGMLLADVHGYNVGKVTREGYEQRVITDPGHAVPLAERWRGLLIPEV